MSKPAAWPASLVLALLVACSPADAVVDPPMSMPAGAGVGQPLRRWMESELTNGLRTRDYSRLARALEALSEITPGDYPQWASIALEAAAAAERHDLEAVRRGCASCHQRYRARYRSTSRSRI